MANTIKSKIKGIFIKEEKKDDNNEPLRVAYWNSGPDYAFYTGPKDYNITKVEKIFPLEKEDNNETAKESNKNCEKKS